MHTPPWLLVQYVTPDASAGSRSPRLGIQSDDVIYAPPTELPGTMIELLDGWDEFELTLRALDVANLAPVAGAVLTIPLTFPRKVICAGANYYDHAAEMGTATPDPSAFPFFFLKPPTTTVIGPGDDIPMPTAADGTSDPSLDWEAELGVVVARRGKNIPTADARSYVAGFVVANDISARGLFPRPNSVAAPFAFDWLAHKAQDGSCPIGPGVVPYWLVPDIDSAAITLIVNGETKQDSTIANMVLGVDGLLSAASALVTLEAGDLILTGTPAGVGMPRGTFLSVGDLVAVEIDGLGRIENRVAAAAG
jgi:2-keto-4-pentenoate hydratase/2-oxohepta-3-ene-1,7-dioic acid hydratase in catechol pathway